MRIPAIMATTAITTLVVAIGGVAICQSAAMADSILEPRPDHVVILIEENHSYDDIASWAPYLNSLGANGARFTQSFALTHPSQPNYVALFSGSMQGLADNSCPHTYTADNLGSQLMSQGMSFTGYAESLPYDGYTGCDSGPYARRHSPWVNFANIPASANLSFDRFPTDFTTLPTLSIVIPNLDNDMHNGSIAAGDIWAKTHLDAYAQWAMTHNSLLIVTADEDDFWHDNQIFTAVYGEHVRVGDYSERIDHYSLLATLEAIFGLPCLANACTSNLIADVWK
jgi:phosphatidylinositol-3-phosphatase